ncbi:hypothetical protein SDC9_134290 [bioreactor metagenome]|uniref:Uncharacterized protein n=1 Tax=bioreactor metagenome TaxID=1076179 RepID=A0A645DCU9_9ZZZZ
MKSIAISIQRIRKLSPCAMGQSAPSPSGMKIIAGRIRVFHIFAVPLPAGMPFHRDETEQSPADSAPLARSTCAAGNKARSSEF